MFYQLKNAWNQSNYPQLILNLMPQLLIFFFQLKRGSETSSDSGSSHININQTETISNAATTSSKLSKTDDEVTIIKQQKNLILK